jgi:signal transduction histidine kinase
MVDILPAWTRSVRFRLALTYSVLVFALALVVLGAVNLGLSRALSGQPVVQEVVFPSLSRTLGGFELQLTRARMVDLERLVNERALDNLRRYSLYTVALLFPLSVGIGWLVAGRALRPVERISGVAREIQSTDLSRRIRLGGTDDEFKRLADTFDAMLDRLEKGYRDQRSFVEDTTHELRNPLAVMATTLDVALSDPDADVDALRHAGEVVRRTIDRTSRTVDELVTFARQDQPGRTMAPVPLFPLLEESVGEYRVAAAARGVDLRTGSAAETTVEGDRDGLKRALGNLLDNAVRLAPEGSEIVASCGAIGSWAWMAVSDQGPGIPEEVHERIFERSWGAADLHDRTRRRSGLGLAIVRQVMAGHGGLVTIRSSAGSGSTFALWLPLDRSARPEDVTADGVHPLEDAVNRS